MSNWREMLEEAKMLLSDGLISEDDYEQLKSEALSLMKQSRLNKSTPASPPSMPSPSLSDTLDGNTIDPFASAQSMNSPYSDTLDGTTQQVDDAFDQVSSDPLEGDTLAGNTVQGMTLMGQELSLTDDNYHQLQKGTMFDQRYTIAMPLGKGGMGMVYQAVDTMTGQQVALKVLLPKFAKQKKVIDSLIHEFSLGQRLNHPNLLQIRHLETRGNTPYIIMELMDGGDAAEFASSRGEVLSPKEVLPILESVCSALSALHKEAIVHLDIKPQNVLMAKDGRIRLADFGISSRMKDQRDGHSGAGTPWYAAPEQLDREVCGVGTDVYAVGMMTYRLLSGEFPFAHNASLEEIKRWHKNGERNFSGVDPALQPILQKACHPNIGQRYRDIQDLYVAISQYLSDYHVVEGGRQNEHLEKYRELYAKVMDDGFLEEWELQQLQAARQKWNIRDVEAKQVEAEFLSQCSAELELVYDFSDLQSAKPMETATIGLNFINASLLNLDSVEVQLKPLGWELYTLKKFSLKGQQEYKGSLSLTLDSECTYNLQLMVHVKDFIGNDQYFVATQMPFHFGLDGVTEVQWAQRLVEKQTESRWKVALMLSDEKAWKQFSQSDTSGKTEFSKGQKQLKKKVEMLQAEAFLQQAQKWETSLDGYKDLEQTISEHRFRLSTLVKQHQTLSRSMNQRIEQKRSEHQKQIEELTHDQEVAQQKMMNLPSPMEGLPTLKKTLREEIFAEFTRDVEPGLSESLYGVIDKIDQVKGLTQILSTIDTTDASKLSAVVNHALVQSDLKQAAKELIRTINRGYNKDPLKGEEKELNDGIAELNKSLQQIEQRRQQVNRELSDVAKELIEQKDKFFSFLASGKIEALEQEKEKKVTEIQELEASIDKIEETIQERQRTFKNRSFAEQQRVYQQYRDVLSEKQERFEKALKPMMAWLTASLEACQVEKQSIEHTLSTTKSELEATYTEQEKRLIKEKEAEVQAHTKAVAVQKEKHALTMSALQESLREELDSFIQSEKENLIQQMNGVDVDDERATLSLQQTKLEGLEQQLVTDLPFSKADLLRYEHLVSDTLLLYYGMFALNMNLKVNDFASPMMSLNATIHRLSKSEDPAQQSNLFEQIVKHSTSTLKAHPKVTLLDPTSNIQKALDAVGEDIVVLSKGVYKQGFVLSKDVYVLGQSGVTIRMGRKDIVEIKDASPCLYGVTIDSTWEYSLDELLDQLSDDAPPQLESEQLLKIQGDEGTCPTLIGCTFSSKSTRGVLVEGARPIFVNSIFASIKDIGILFTKNAYGTVHKCNFTKISSDAIRLNGAGANIRDNEIQAGTYGIRCKSKSTGTVRGNKISQTGWGGIGIFGSDVTVEANEIYNCEKEGLKISGACTSRIIDNKIYETGEAVVSIGKGANPTITGNEFYNGKKCGIHLYEKAEGTIKNNKIYANAESGISIETDANSLVEANKIYNGKQSGVYVHNKGRGVIKKNQIYGNGYGGVSVKEESNPEVLENDIYENTQSGVYVYDKGRGVFKRNKIHGNGFSGVSIKSESNPIFERNEIYKAKQSGVYVHENGLGVFTNNKIYENAWSGIKIKGGGNPTVQDNQIYSGAQDGIYIQENGLGIIDNNKIYGCKLNGIDVHGSSPTIKNNHIYDNQKVGLLIRDSGGSYNNNLVSNNALAKEKGTSNIVLRKAKEPILQGNEVRQGRGGILIDDGSTATLLSNTVSDVSMNSIEVREQSTATIRKGTIQTGSEGSIAIFVHTGASCTIEGCTMNKPKKYAVCCGMNTSDTAEVLVRDCTITNSESNGILIRGSGVVATIENSTFKNNTSSAIRVDSGAKANISGNQILDGNNGGLFFKGKSKGLVENNTIARNRLANIAVFGGAYPVIRSNKIYDGQAEGISIQDSSPHINGNEVYGNGATNVMVVNSSPTINNNTIKNGKKSGLWYKKSSKGVCEHNTIIANTFSGIVISSKSSPTIKSNKVTHNKNSGVWVQEGAGGTITNNTLTNNRNKPLSLDDGHKCSHSGNKTS